MDRLPIPSIPGIVDTTKKEVEPRGCAMCDYSWNLPPTNRELKDGTVDTRMYCVAKQGTFVLNGETFPRLASMVRGDQKLCGAKGGWWRPMRLWLTPREVDRPAPVSVPGVALSRTEPAKRRYPMTAHRERRQSSPQVETQSEQSSTSVKVRKPYPT